MINFSGRKASYAPTADYAWPDWLSSLAVEHVEPARLGGLADDVARHAVDGETEQHRRTRHVIAPAIMRHLLEMPAQLAGRDLERDTADGVQVVAGADLAVVYSSDSIGVNDFPTKLAWDALTARGMNVDLQFVAESELAVQSRLEKRFANIEQIGTFTTTRLYKLVAPVPMARLASEAVVATTT